MANAGCYGLAAYVFGGEWRALELAHGIRVGATQVNGLSLLSLAPSAPRSAWGLSGLGDEGTLETLMHAIGMFDRPHALTLEGFEGSGADWLASYKPVIENGRTVIASPHKVYGPDSNDLVLQLRKAGIAKVILGGMSSNLCTESHMRALVEAGFEVMVVTDATAGAITEHYDGYAASLVNFRMIASAVDNTANTVRKIAAAYP